VAHIPSDIESERPATTGPPPTLNRLGSLIWQGRRTTRSWSIPPPPKSLISDWLSRAETDLAEEHCCQSAEQTQFLIPPPLSSSTTTFAFFSGWPCKHGRNKLCRQVENNVLQGRQRTFRRIGEASNPQNEAQTFDPSPADSNIYSRCHA